MAWILRGVHVAEPVVPNTLPPPTPVVTPVEPIRPPTEADLSEIKSLVANHFKCAICQEILVMAQTISCNHCFCTSCIDEWITNGHHECPVCRQVIRSRHSLRAIDRAVDLYYKMETQDEREAREELITSRDEQLVRVVQTRIQQHGVTPRGHGLLGGHIMGVTIGPGSRRRRRRRRRRRATATITVAVPPRPSYGFRPIPGAAVAQPATFGIRESQ